MSLRNIDIAELVARAQEYAKSKAPGPGVANWIGAITYDEDHIVSLGDGTYQIGELYEINGMKAPRGDPARYPIFFNPATQRLQVKLPKACRPASWQR